MSQHGFIVWPCSSFKLPAGALKICKVHFLADIRLPCRDCHAELWLLLDVVSACEMPQAARNGSATVPASWVRSEARSAALSLASLRQREEAFALSATQPPPSPTTAPLCPQMPTGTKEQSAAPRRGTTLNRPRLGVSFSNDGNKAFRRSHIPRPFIRQILVASKPPLRVLAHELRNARAPAP